MEANCLICGIEMEKNNNRKYCESCSIIKQRERSKIHYINNKEIVLQRRKDRYLKNREKELAQASEWQDNNKDKVKEIQKRYHYKNKDRISEERKEHRKIHPEIERGYRQNFINKNPEHYKEYVKDYNYKNKDRISKRQHERYINKAEEIKKSKKNFRIEHPEIVRQWNKNRVESGYEAEMSRKKRAMKKNVIHNFSKEEWTLKLTLTKGICPSCGKEVGVRKLTLDHDFPVSKANEEFKTTGKKRVYTIKDVNPLCKSCNSIKNNRVISLEDLKNEVMIRNKISNKKYESRINT